MCKGFMQREGVEYSEHFAPLAKFASIRLLIVIAALYKFRLVHLDVITVFLNPDVEEMYIQFSEGVTVQNAFSKKNKTSL